MEEVGGISEASMSDSVNNERTIREAVALLLAVVFVAMLILNAVSY